MNGPEADFLAAFEVSSVGAAQADPLTGRFLRVNEAMCRLTGYAEGELLSMTFRDLTHPDDRAADFDRFQRMVRGEAQEYRSEKRYVRKDGGVIWVSVAANLVRGRDGRPLRTSAVIQDVTARRQAEGDQKFLLEIAEEIRREENAEGLLLGVVRAVGRHLGVSRSLFLEIDFDCDAATVHPDFHAESLPPLAGRIPLSRFSPESVAIMRGGRTLVNDDIRNNPRTAGYYERGYKDLGMEAFVGVPLMRDGRWVAALAVIMGEPRRWTAREVGLLESVAEHAWLAVEKLRINDALRLSEERHRGIVNQTVCGVAEVDLTGRFLFVNDRYCDITGYSREELLGGVRMQEITHEEDLPRNLELFGECLTEGKPFGIEKRYVRRDGSHVWVHNSVSAVCDAVGRARSVAAISVDITERRRAEQQVVWQKQPLEALAVGKELSEILALTSRMIESLVPGARASVLLADDGAKLLRCGSAESLPAEYNAAIEGIAIGEGVGSCGTAAFRREPVIVSDIARDPLWKDFRALAAAHGLASCWSHPILAPDGKLLGTFATYFTEPRGPAAGDLAMLESAARLAGIAVHRKRTEERLRESEEQFRALFDSIDEGFCVVEVIFDDAGKPADYRFVQANPAFSRLTGLEGAVGRTAREMVPGLEEFWFEAYGRVALTGEAVRFENRSEPMGRWFDVFASRLGGATSRRVAIVFNNITERKQAEQERDRLLAQERAARAEAEESNRLKDEFLATLSHELRTPLTAVLGWADLLTDGKLDEGMRGQALDVIQRNARAQNQLIGDLLDVSRIITGKLRIETRPVDLRNVLGSAVDVVRPAGEAKGIRIVQDFDPGPFDLAGDPDRLQQVVWNLLSNAVKFTPAVGRVDVRLRRAGGHAVVSVSDTGQGIAPDFLPYVFDRFRQADGSTTRRHGGLGLGLSIVRHLVELHGGEVAAESEGPGLGATFIVRLPLGATSPRAEAGRAHAAAESEAPLAGLRVLVVDDDTAALSMLRAAFEQGGAIVETAASAASAFAAFSRSAPDVLVSDIGMPDEDGYSLIAAVRALPPERGGRVPALALTAYAAPQDRERTRVSGFQAHVAKPVEPADLVAAVADLLSPK